MVVADFQSVLAALERFDPAVPWEDARSQVIPILPRLRPMPHDRDLELVRTMAPPGILVSFGIDLGPALTFVGTPLLERWKIDAPTLAATALDNLDRLAASCTKRAVVHDAFIERPLSVIQTGRGFGASLLLVPEHLPRLIGPGPHLLLAPMRDILLCLPGDVDRELAGFLLSEWEALDPNCLHLGAFRHEDGRVVAESLEEAAGRA